MFSCCWFAFYSVETKQNKNIIIIAPIVSFGKDLIVFDRKLPSRQFFVVVAVVVLLYLIKLGRYYLLCELCYKYSIYLQPNCKTILVRNMIYVLTSFFLLLCCENSICFSCYELEERKVLISIIIILLIGLCFILLYCCILRTV